MYLYDKKSNVAIKLEIRIIKYKHVMSNNNKVDSLSSFVGKTKQNMKEKVSHVLVMCQWKQQAKHPRRPTS